jgi:hypothetical protein
VLVVFDGVVLLLRNVLRALESAKPNSAIVATYTEAVLKFPKLR